MLASALDSHPDICCTGEYGMTEKFPIGRSPGRVNGCIVQSYHLDRGIAPSWLSEAKLIWLTRPLQDIALSRHYNNIAGTSSEQHLEPVKRDKHYEHVLSKTYIDLHKQRDVVTDFILNKEHLCIGYQSLCRNADIRTIRREVMHLLCDFLGVKHHPLRPVTHKPS